MLALKMTPKNYNLLFYETTQSLGCLTKRKLHLSWKILTNCSPGMLMNGTLQTEKGKRMFMLQERKINLRNLNQFYFLTHKGLRLVRQDLLTLQFSPKLRVFHLLSVISAAETKFLLLLARFAVYFQE